MDIAAVCLAVVVAVLAIEGNGGPARSKPADRGKTAATTARSIEGYGWLPIAFEINRGQTAPEVQFLTRGRGYTLFLTGSEAVLTLHSARAKSRGKNQKAKMKNAAPRSFFNPPRRAAFPALLEPPSAAVSSRLQETTDNGRTTTDRRQSSAPLFEVPHNGIDNHQSSVVRLRLVGANPNRRATGRDELPGKSHYFLGSDPKKWRTNVPNYTGVKFQDVYPGIDLVYYGKESGVRSQEPEVRSQESEVRSQRSETKPDRPSTDRGQLEFDFVVTPGADPRAIRLAVETGDSKLENRNSQIQNRQSAIGNHQSAIAVPLWVDANGDLVIPTHAGEVRFRKPLVYQVQNPKSKIPNRQFVDGRYVLDGDQVTFELAAYDSSLPLVIDPVLSYSSYLGGSGFDYGTGIAVDSTGNAYVAGYTNSVDFPLASPAQGAPGGGTCGSGLDTYPCWDVFLTKLDPTGSALVYSTYFGGSGEDYGTSIAVDSSGNTYVAGFTNSTDLPVANAVQSTHGGGTCGVAPNPFPCFDAFAAKLDATGTTLVYSTYLGGSADDYAQGIAVDAAQNAVVTGFTASADFPTAQALQATYGGAACDAFVAKLAAEAASLIYSTYLGGGGEDYGTRVAIDSSGSAYATGYTNSSNFPITSAFQPAYGGGTCGSSLSNTPCFDAYVAKVSPDGSELGFSTYLGGTGGDYGYAVAGDASGNVFVTGLTTSTDFPVTAGSFQAAGGGTSVDAFVTKLAASGSAAVYSTYLGGLGAEAGLDVTVDALGNAYLAGYVHGTDFPLASPLQEANAGYFDAFLAKLNAAGSALVFSSYLGGSGHEKAHGVALDAAGNAYVVGGTFSSDFPVTTGAFQTAYAGGAYEAFLAKIADLRAPVVSPRQVTLHFAEQGVGTVSPPQTVRLQNSGDAELLLGTMTLGGDFAQANTCPGALPGGSECSLEITFAPTELGPRHGEMEVTHNAYGSPFVVSLLGTGVAAPAVVLFPTALDFPGQPLGTTSAAGTVTLSNTGQAVLNIGGIAASGDFAQTNTCGSPIPVEGSCTLQVSFTPTVPGSHLGALTIQDNAPGSPQVVALTGLGLGPAVGLAPTSLDFGDQLVGTTSPPEGATLTNTGNRPLEIASIVTTGDFTQTNTCGGSVDSGASCGIRVTFAPSARGSQNGLVTITDNALNSPQVIALAGRGIIPGMCSLDRVSLAFGEQRVGTTSGPQVVTMTNNGDLPLSISSIGVVGDFAETHTCGATLDPAAACTIGVTFTPTVSGSRTGALTISHSGTNSPATVNLSGTGIAPEVTLSPTSLDFGKQTVGTTSAARPVTLTNSGTAMLNITTILASGDFAQTNNCGASLAPAAGCTINVTFTPTATGKRTGAVRITDDASGSPHVVSLRGTGSGRHLSLSVEDISFGHQLVGTTTAPQTVTLTNSGATEATLSEIAVSGDFARATNCEASLAAGASCTISITFTPLSAGARTGTLAVANGIPEETQTAELAGIGTEFSLAASPTAATVTAGGLVNYTLTLTPISGFSERVSLNCTGVPRGATCSLSPSSVTFDGASPATATVTVKTAAHGVASPGGSGTRRFFPLPISAIGFLQLLLLLALSPPVVDRYGRRRARPLVAATCLSLLLWASCGGGGAAVPSPPAGGTPPGSYTLILTGTFGEYSRSASVILTVE